MKVFYVALTFGFQAVSGALGGEPPLRLVTSEGTVYEEIRAVKAKGGRLSFIHRDGSASVPFEKLPEEVREFYRYDAAQAAEHAAEEKREEEAQTAFEREVDAKVAKDKTAGVKSAGLVAKAKEQIVRHYFSNDRAVLPSGRIKYAKRYLTEAGIPEGKQDGMIQSWMPEAKAYTAAKNEAWAKVTPDPLDQLRSVPGGMNMRKKEPGQALKKREVKTYQ